MSWHSPGCGGKNVALEPASAEYIDLELAVLWGGAAVRCKNSGVTNVVRGFAVALTQLLLRIISTN